MMMGLSADPLLLEEELEPVDPLFPPFPPVVLPTRVIASLLAYPAAFEVEVTAGPVESGEEAAVAGVIPPMEVFLIGSAGLLDLGVPCEVRGSFGPEEAIPRRVDGSDDDLERALMAERVVGRMEEEEVEIERSKLLDRHGLVASRRLWAAYWADRRCHGFNDGRGDRRIFEGRAWNRVCKQEMQVDVDMVIELMMIQLRIFRRVQSSIQCPI
jgi:hypothetical protein